ncbi:MAG TPA: ABC transporter permease [Solirubrobacter sp.]|nr:ABC transporter permease [Solirubrobacter sp.]
MHKLLARRFAALVLTTLLAVSAAHVLFNGGLDRMSWGAAATNTPAHLADVVRGELGQTNGAGCNPTQRRRPEFIQLCASWGRQSVAGMMRDRVPIDLQLIVGGLLLGTLLGLLAGRWCAGYPNAWITRGLRGAIALLLSCPPYVLALAVLLWFSWNSGAHQLPFVSGQGDYRPFSDNPLAFLKAMWIPCLCCALPLAAFVARIAEASMTEALGEDFVRTARAKGLGERQILDRHVLRASMPPVAAMTGVNVSTMLITAATIEYAFGIPGMFLTIRGAIISRDVPVLEALVLEGVILVAVANFLVDAFQSRLDPRVRAASA